MAVFGSEFQEKLLQQKYFLVRPSKDVSSRGHTLLSPPLCVSPFDPVWCERRHTEETAEIQAAFPAAVWTSVPVSFDAVVFTVVWSSSMCFTLRVKGSLCEVNNVDTAVKTNIIEI